jgi:hypothetical protein
MRHERRSTRLQRRRAYAGARMSAPAGRLPPIDRPVTHRFKPDEINPAIDRFASHAAPKHLNVF